MKNWIGVNGIHGGKNTFIVKGGGCSSFSPFKIKFLEIFWFFKGFTSLLNICVQLFLHISPTPWLLFKLQTRLQKTVRGFKSYFQTIVWGSTSKSCFNPFRLLKSDVGLCCLTSCCIRENFKHMPAISCMLLKLRQKGSGLLLVDVLLYMLLGHFEKWDLTRCLKCLTTVGSRKGLGICEAPFPSTCKALLNLMIAIQKCSIDKAPRFGLKRNFRQIQT